MRKFVSILLIIFTMCTLLTGCKSEERKQTEEDYKAKAQVIFDEYFAKNYPDENYKAEDLKVLTERHVDFFVPSYKTSKMVKGTIKTSALESVNVYCYVDDNDNDVYTDEYFEKIKNEVKGIVDTRVGQYAEITGFNFEGTWKSQWTMGFAGAEFEEYILLPFSIRNAEDLFNYKDNNFFYHLNVSVKMKKDIEPEEIQYKLFFDGMNNTAKNDVDLSVVASDDSTSHFTSLSAHKLENGDIKVGLNPKTVRFEEEDYNLQYSEHFYDIKVEKIPCEYNKEELSEEEKEFIKKYFEDGFIKTDYIYKFVMELKYPFYESDDMVFTVEQDGVNIIYNYYQYGDVTLCASENYIRVVKRYTENLADRTGKNGYNFLEVFRPEEKEDSNKLTMYMDIYIDD